MSLLHCELIVGKTVPRIFQRLLFWGRGLGRHVPGYPLLKPLDVAFCCCCCYSYSLPFSTVFCPHRVAISGFQPIQVVAKRFMALQDV